MKLDLAAMNSLLMLLKSNPATNDCALRPLLTEYVHHDAAIDATYIRQFRQRVAYFYATNPNYLELFLEEANMLLEESPITEGEHKVLDDHIVRINFNNILLKVMAEGSSTWEALAFLHRCKREMPEFDFRIRIKQNNHPCSLVYNTANERLNVIRYGDAISVDMQYMQHNGHNWSYFAPVINDSDIHVGVICESIIITEDIDTYEWVLKK